MTSPFIYYTAFKHISNKKMHFFTKKVDRLGVRLPLRMNAVHFAVYSLQKHLAFFCKYWYT